MAKRNKLGALWSRETRSGGNLLKGVLDIDGKKIDIVIWANGYKENDRQPDFYIYEDDYRKQQAAQSSEFPEGSGSNDDGDEIPF